MARAALAALALLVWRAAGDGSSSTYTSVAQIVDTLRTLHRSIEEAGHDAEGLFSKRQQWCKATLRSLEADEEADHVALKHLTTDLEEDKAAVEEAEGAAQQVQAEITLVQHTLRQTEEMLRTIESEMVNASLLQTANVMHKQYEADMPKLRTMVQIKRQTLTSLQGELELMLPSLAQLQARAAETGRRLADGGASAAGRRRLLAALRGGCRKSETRSGAQAAARAKGATSISTALQALRPAADAAAAAAKGSDSSGSTAGAMAAADAAADTSASSPPPAAAGDGGLSEEVSFVQLGRAEELVASEGDLLAIFGDRHVRPAELSAAPAGPGHGSLLSQREVAGSPRRVKDARPEIQRLLANLKGQGNPDQKEWCAQEQAQKQLGVRLILSLAAEMSAEIDAHTEAEAQLKGDMGRLRSRSAALAALAREAERGAALEQSLIASSSKDQRLAVKILLQAITILTDFGESGRLPSQAQRGAASAVDALRTAQGALEAQSKAAAGLRREAAGTMLEIAAKANETVDVLEGERRDLEFALDSHTSQRARCGESKGIYEDELTEARAYLKGLVEDCKPGLVTAEVRERRAQIHALQDAEMVLDGKRISRSDGSRGLRGGSAKAAAAAAAKNLSPIERAAIEMGVSVDGG